MNEEYLRRLAAGDREVHRHFTNRFSPILSIKLRMKAATDTPFLVLIARTSTH
jgi:hypothetical protein